MVGEHVVPCRVRTANYTLHPSQGVGVGADFVRTFARRG